MKYLIYILFLFPVCIYGQKEKLYKTGDLVSRYVDSLRKNKIDTVLVFTKNCISCMPVKQELKKGKPVVKKNVHESEPAYIFWSKNGLFYVKKIDQHYSYQPVQRPAWSQYPIYDFFARNKEEIMSEELAGYRVPGAGNPSRSEYEYSLIHFSGDVNTDYTTMKMILPADSSFVEIMDQKSMPVMNNLDSIPYGNTKRTYYNNFMLKKNEWKRVIESELFEIEFKQLWRKE